MLECTAEERHVHCLYDCMIMHLHHAYMYALYVFEYLHIQMNLVIYVVPDKSRNEMMWLW